MIRTLVVDDEPLARSRMRRLLGVHPDVEIVGEAGSGEEAVARCLELRPQLLLLDVDMPGGTGTEALDKIRRSLPEGLRPAAVFTTAHAEHAVKAFALEGLDYLLKPVEPAELERALQRVRKLLWSRIPTGVPTPPTGPPVSTAPAQAPAPAPAPPSGRLAAHRGGRVLNLDVDDIALVELEDTIAFAWTAEGRFRLAGTLAEVEARLPSPPFLRVSRAAVVQLKWVKHLEPLGAGVWLAKLDAPLDREVIDGVVADAFVFSGNMEVTGRVDDQLFVFAGDVELPGEVGGDAFVFSGDLEVTGAIGGDLYVVSGDVVLAESSSVGGRVFISAGDVEVLGSVGGDIEATAGALLIGGTVGGDVDAAVGRLRLVEGASIGGDLEYIAGEETEIPAGVAIGGDVLYTQGEAGHDGVSVEIDVSDAAHHGSSGFGLAGRVFAMLSGLVLGFALLGLGGPLARRSVAMAHDRPAFQLGLGFGLLLVTPVVALVLAVLILPLPLSAVLMSGLMILMLLGRVVAATALGTWLLTKAGKPEASPYAAMAAGLAVIVLLAWIPVLGFFVTLAAVLIGMGALFNTLREARLQA